MTNWPLQRDCDDFYGNPRGKDGCASPAWERANLVSVTPPFWMTYAGHPVSKIKIHQKCADSLQRVFNTIWTVAGKNQRIVDEWGASKFGGSYNFRLMRGLNTLSMHSYGCAIDLDPERNGLGNKAGNFTIGCPVVQAFLSEGATWGGDWHKDGKPSKTRSDFMHFQFANLSF